MENSPEKPSGRILNVTARCVFAYTLLYPGRHMASLRAVTLLPFFLAAALSPAQDQPAFKAAARLVEVTVVALDRRSGPVTDLEKGDFTLSDNGKPREIAFVRYEGGPEVETKAHSLPPHTFTNRVELTSGPPRNIVALVLDSINTEVREQMFVKAQAMQFLRALGPQTRVAVFQIGRDLRILHDFTSDMDSLRSGLERIRVEFPPQHTSDIEQMAREADELLSWMGRRRHSEARVAEQTKVFAAQLANEVNYNTMIRGNRVEATLATLESLGRHLSGIPGRKSVIWISNGIAVTSANMTARGRGNPNPSSGVNFIASIRKTSQGLADAGVSLYTVDAKGLTVPGSLPDVSKNPYDAGTFSEILRAEAYSTDTRGAFGAMSSITGGRAFFNTNKFAEPVRRVVEDFRGTYSIGFYASGEPDDKWHDLKVAVNRRGVSLLHRRGYVFAPDRPQEWGTEELQQALANPLGSSSIHMTATCAPAAGSEPGSLELKLEIEARDIAFREEDGQKHAEADVIVAEKTAGGSIRFRQETIGVNLKPEEREEANKSGIPYRRVWKPGDDTAVIRVLVRDKTTGQFGTLDVPLPR